MENIVNVVSLLIGFLPLIIAINALLTTIGMPKRFAPIVNIVLGFLALPEALELLPIYPSIIACLIVGLTAGGFYDLGKSNVKTVLDKKE